MKKELHIMIYSMINNMIIAAIKMVGGLSFGLSSMVADGMHTMSDFITDIVSLVGIKMSKKRANKHHPFGYGKIEYLSNLFIGIVLFILGLYIFISSLSKPYNIPKISILIIVIVTFILKLIAIVIMNKVGNEIGSHNLKTAVMESKQDLYSTIGVGIITVLLQFSNDIWFLKYADKLGSILISLIIFKTAIDIIIDNSTSLIGNVDPASDKNKLIEDILTEYEVDNYDYDLIQYGPYYKLDLRIELDPNTSLKEIMKLENKLKKEFKKVKEIKIKYTVITVTDDIRKKD